MPAFVCTQIYNLFTVCVHDIYIFIPISLYPLRYITFIDFDVSQVRGFNDALDEIDANYRRTLQNIGGEQHVRCVLIPVVREGPP